MRWAALILFLAACAGARAERPVHAPSGSALRLPHSSTQYAQLFADCGRDGFNNGIPVSRFVQHVEFCEGDPYSSADYMQALRIAGLPYASFYTDTWYNYACAAPYREPAGPCNHEPGSQLNGRASAFLHDAAGVRLYREYEPGRSHEALNLLDPAVPAAIHRETQAMLQGPCSLCNLFEADDSGTDFARGWYGFSAQFPVEITSAEQFARAHEQELRAYPRPLYFNGVGAGFDWDGPQSHPLLAKLLTDPQIIGAESEGCWTPKQTEPIWKSEQHAIAFVAARGKRVFCLNYDSDTPAKRIFATASLWLAYVPLRTIMWKENAQSPDRSPSGHVITGPYREDEIVPQYPLQRGPIESLQSAGVYGREFGACYWSNRRGLDEAGRIIGPCAAIVNPTDADQPLPHLSLSYHHALSVNEHTVFAGGTARFDAPVPSVVSAKSGLLLGP